MTGIIIIIVVVIVGILLALSAKGHDNDLPQPLKDMLKKKKK